MVDVRLFLGDCLDKLLLIESASVDAVITDPPYPCIKRDYGYWTVEEWWALIVEGVIPEVRRILKPTGSAVFILQPNSEHVGQMRGWLWRFMYWVTENWNMVQDVWWWNVAAMPTVGATQFGLFRPSIKACVWCGTPNCYRDQEAILWSESDRVKSDRQAGRINLKRNDKHPSGHSVKRDRMTEAVVKRGGVTPFNLLPIPNTRGSSRDHSGAYGHGAGTPLKLAEWWTRYICPPGGTICDPFAGSGTMGVAAVQNGCNFIGIEKLDEPGYFPTAQERITGAQPKMEGPQQAPLVFRIDPATPKPQQMDLFLDKGT